MLCTGDSISCSEISGPLTILSIYLHQMQTWYVSPHRSYKNCGCICLFMLLEWNYACRLIRLFKSGDELIWIGLGLSMYLSLSASLFLDFISGDELWRFI